MRSIASNSNFFPAVSMAGLVALHLPVQPALAFESHSLTTFGFVEVDTNEFPIHKGCCEIFGPHDPDTHTTTQSDSFEIQWTLEPEEVGPQKTYGGGSGSVYAGLGSRRTSLHGSASISVVPGSDEVDVVQGQAAFLAEASDTFIWNHPGDDVQDIFGFITITLGLDVQIGGDPALGEAAYAIGVFNEFVPEGKGEVIGVEGAGNYVLTKDLTFPIQYGHATQAEFELFGVANAIGSGSTFVDAANTAFIHTVNAFDEDMNLINDRVTLTTGSGAPFVQPGEIFVPEPTSAAVLSVGAIGLLRRRARCSETKRHRKLCSTCYLNSEETV